MSEILIGRNEDSSVSLDPRLSNRHGMMASATGAGKSVSLIVLAKEPATGGASWTDAVRDALVGASRRQGMLDAMAKPASRAAGSRFGQQIVRGAPGGIVGGKR